MEMLLIKKHKLVMDLERKQNQTDGENIEIEEEKVQEGLYITRPKKREIELMEFEEKQFGDSPNKF